MTKTRKLSYATEPDPGPRFPARDATAAYPSNALASWLLLGGMLLPASMTFFLGDAKFYPGRLIILLLLLPAPLLVFRKGRRPVVCDFFAFAMSAWIIGVTLLTGRYGSLSSSAAMVIEFLGGYVVARAYLFGRPALDVFIRALKIVIGIMIAIAVLEHLTGRLIANDIVSAFSGQQLLATAEVRDGWVRAISTFPHPILYGAFCVAAGVIFLYSERRAPSRLFYVALCFFGCTLAMSSAPLLAFSIAIFVYCYGKILKTYSWRWRVLASIVGACLVAIFLLTNNPTSWIVEHMTLDPSTGYFRKAAWQRAIYNIDLSPLTGYGFGEVGDPSEFFDRASVDSVWLVLALRFGYPVMVLLLLTNVSSFYGFWRKTAGPTSAPYMDDMRTAFTLVVVVFMLVGLTVHYWNAIWIFWGICIGIRASLQEQYFASIRASAACSVPRRLSVHGRPQAG
jgi:hypothetical protein